MWPFVYFHGWLSGASTSGHSTPPAGFVSDTPATSPVAPFSLPRWPWGLCGPSNLLPRNDQKHTHTKAYLTNSSVEWELFHIALNLKAPESKSWVCTETLGQNFSFQHSSPWLFQVHSLTPLLSWREHQGLGLERVRMWRVCICVSVCDVCLDMCVHVCTMLWTWRQEAPWTPIITSRRLTTFLFQSCSHFHPRGVIHPKRCCKCDEEEILPVPEEHHVQILLQVLSHLSYFCLLMSRQQVYALCKTIQNTMAFILM